MVKKAGVRGGKKTTSKKPKLTSAQRKANLRTRQHIRLIKDVFTSFGFRHVSGMSSKNFEFKGRPCDFDDVFLLDNILVLVEHTTHGDEYISKHLINKKIVFDYINQSPSEFVGYVRENFSDFSSIVDPVYQDHHFQVKIVYASLNNIKNSIKNHVKNVHFLDYPYLRYFKNLALTIKTSAKWEMLGYLGVRAGEFSRSILSESSSSNTFNGSVLPESQSHFPAGYKVVSFYVSAGELIQRAYVLRRDSWRENNNIYQRLLGRKKIESLRKHLLEKKGVAINNIIVTLPESTKVLDLSNKQVETDKIKSVQLSKVELPVDFNSIGIIDGQHRVFSYYEGGSNESQMAVLRAQQNLLVTGIIFPENTSELVRDRFSASLFLQINTNQSKVKPELIQEIGVILRPFAVQSIARRVLRELNNRGPFSDHFATAFSEGPKVKTATVVSYGITPLVRPNAVDGLFNVWKSTNRDLLVKGGVDPSIDEAVVIEFVEFCVKEINTFTGAVRSYFPSRWTADQSVPDRMLTTVIVNGLFHCLRRICGSGKLLSFEDYKNKLSGIEIFDFSGYGSNRYNQLGQQLALDFFDIAKTSADE